MASRCRKELPENPPRVPSRRVLLSMGIRMPSTVFSTQLLNSDRRTAQSSSFPSTQAWSIILSMGRKSNPSTHRKVVAKLGNQSCGVGKLLAHPRGKYRVATRYAELG